MASNVRNHLAMSLAGLMASALSFDGSHYVPSSTITYRPSKAHRGGYDVTPKKAHRKHPCGKRRNH